MEKDTKNISILKQAYDILKQDEEKDSWEFKPTPPTKSVNFNSFNIPNSRKKTVTKLTLSKVLYFIDMKKRIRFTDKEHNGLTVMGISVKNKKLKSICGSIMGVSRLIDYMIEIGLLAEYDESYQFKAIKKDKNHSKQYCYSYSTELKIKEYCNENNIEKFEHVNGSKKLAIAKVTELDEFKISDVKFSSKLNLQKPSNYSQKQFEEYLYSALYHNYPSLKKYQGIANYINDKFYKNDEARKIHYEPSFEWNSKGTAVRKIGIRATNSLCNCKKKFEEKDLKKNRKFLYREDVLKKYGLNKDYDVKSSVPRVTILLNKGNWLSSDVDIYESINEDFNKRCPEEFLLWNEKNREVCKHFHMPAQFDSSNMLSAHIKRRISLKTEYKKDEWVRLDNAMECYKKTVENVLGKLWDNEIFFHESNIYIDVLKELLERGIDVLQVYDAFYYDKEIEDIEDIINKCALNYYYKEINNNNDNNNNNNNDNNNINKYKEINKNKYKENNIYTVVNIFNNYKNKEHIELPDKEKTS